MKRPFCVIGGSFLTAALLASFLSDSVQVILLITCTLLFFFALIFLKAPHRCTVAVACFCAATALGLFLFQTQLNYRPVAALDQQTISIRATITDITQRTNHRYSYTLTVTQTDTDLSLPKFTTILYTNAQLSAECYDDIEVTADFFLPSNQDSFNSIRYYQADGIYILASLNEDHPVTVYENHNRPISYYFHQLNDSLCRTVDQRLPSPESSILKGLVLGDREDIPFSLEQDYTKAGIVHLLAISGVHVSILAGFLYLVLSRLKIPRRISTLLQMAGVAGFILLSGMQISSLRAGGMIFLLLAGRMVYRRADPLNSLCCAGFFIVLSNVYAIMDIGFLMSFCATLGILLCYRPISHRLIQKLNLTGTAAVKVIELISLSFSANLFLLPVYINVFGTLSIISILSNVIVSLFASVELILGFILVFFLAFPIPAVITAPLCTAETLLIQLQNAIASFLGNFPFATIGLDNDYVVIWMIISIIICAAVFLYRKRKSYFCQAALFITALFVLTYSVFMICGSNQTRVCIIGDGTTSNIIVIDHQNATVISTKDDDYIDELTYHYLQKNGISRIQNLILAYPDFELYQDTLNLTQSMPIENIFYHQENTLCRSVLNEQSSRIGAISDRLRITENENLTFDFSYDDSDLNLLINLRGTSILVSHSEEELQRIQPDIACMAGNIYDPIVDLSSKYLVILQKQYRPVTADMEYQNTYQTFCEYIITSEGTLKEKEKGEFFCLS
jgi:competence protein ComEC